MFKRLRPKKSLGQNFLTDKNIAQKIVSFLELKPDDCLIEIGPGRGVLTELIVKENGIQFLAIEKDNELAALLKNQYDEKDVSILHEDFMNVNLSTLDLPKTKKWKVIGNIPYNITTPILFHLVEHRNLIDRVVLTVQKEFADRLIATEGREYGRISVMLGHVANVSAKYQIDKGSFKPVPKVDSSVIQIDFKEQRTDNSFEKLFEQLVKAAFNLRRKKILNNLKSILTSRSVETEKIENYFKENALPLGARAEHLSIQQFEALTDFVLENSKASTEK